MRGRQNKNTTSNTICGKPENTILFVGYQAMNTLGRSLVEGANTAKLFGEEVVVRAEILVLPGVSGHADVDGLDRWIKVTKVT